MPESRKEQPSVGIGGTVAVAIEPAVANIQNMTASQISSGSTVIPESAYKVELHNTGLTDITVNGQLIAPNDRYQAAAVFNPITNRYDMTPSLTVVIPTDGSAYYVAYRPSL